MPFVLDASVTLAWCFSDERTPYSDAIFDMLSTTYALVPALWPVEVLNVLTTGERKLRITKAGSDTFLKTLAELSIRVVPATLDSSIELLSLTRRHRLSAYDASYLELAMQEKLPIATLDKDVLRAAPLEGVVIVEQSKLYLN